jgi:hypothetical protein
MNNALGVQGGTMEILVDCHVRDGILKEHLLHQYQFACQTGKSTETALHTLVTYTETAGEHVIALGAFPDIEGAFGRTSFKAIIQAADHL